jgi:FkbM family methyltransferase
MNLRIDPSAPRTAIGSGSVERHEMVGSDKLVVDIGLNNGDDTEHYLARGFNVVAVEANPELVEAGRRRFADAIAAGKLRLLNVGIAQEPGCADFYINQTEDVWSSFVPEWGQRGGKFSVVSVPTTTLSALLREFGTPYYLKIDIEGHEWICLKDLTVTPQYVSIEALHLEFLAFLWSKGYREFKVVNQNDHNAQTGFRAGSSGPVSDSITDWDSLETAAYDWLHIQLGRPERTSLGHGWYDFHAKLGGEELANGHAKRPLRFRMTRHTYWRTRAKLSAAVTSLTGYRRKRPIEYR